MVGEELRGAERSCLKGATHFFYLKGGRAIAELLRPEIKTSPLSNEIKDFIAGVNGDWDTQVVINPHLSLKAWYEVYRELHDTILVQLLACQEAFTKEITKASNTPPSPWRKDKPKSETSVERDELDKLSPPPPLDKLDDLDKEAKKLAQDIKARSPDDKRVVQYLHTIARMSHEHVEKKKTKSEITKPPHLAPLQKNRAYFLGCQSVHPLQLLESVPRLMHKVEEDDWKDEIRKYYPFHATGAIPIGKDVKRDDVKQTSKFCHVVMNYGLDAFLLFRLMVKFSYDSDEQDHTSLRSELIDVSIPRRDTVETFEQWTHTRYRLAKVGPKKDIPVPSHLYYIDEYILMLREVFASQSRSARKFPKRLTRGYMLCMSLDPDFAEHVEEMRGEVKKALPKTEAVIGTVEDQGVTVTMTALAQQFLESYDLADDGGLRNQLDVLLEAGYKAALASGYKEKYVTFGAVIWAGHLTSGLLLDGHLKSREEQLQWYQMDEKSHKLKFFEEKERRFRASNYECFVKAIYTGLEVLLATSPSYGFDHEMRLAVSGAYAAHLHLTHAGGSSDLPVSFLEIVVYCGKVEFKASSEKVDLATARKFLTANVLEPFRDNEDVPQYEVVDADDGELLIYWPGKVDWPKVDVKPPTWPSEAAWNDQWGKNFADAVSLKATTIAGYRPLFARIRFVSVPSLPELSFIRGFPVISLRELVVVIDQLTGRATEFGMVGRLKKTSRELKKLLTGGEAGRSASVASVKRALTFRDEPPAEKHAPCDVLGIRNEGNTCYINSVLQLLDRLDLAANVIQDGGSFANKKLTVPVQKLLAQLAKDRKDGTYCKQSNRSFTEASTEPIRQQLLNQKVIRGLKTQEDASEVLFAILAAFDKTGQDPPSKLWLDVKITTTYSLNGAAEVKVKDASKFIDLKEGLQSKTNATWPVLRLHLPPIGKVDPQNLPYKGGADTLANRYKAWQVDTKKPAEQQANVVHNKKNYKGASVTRIEWGVKLPAHFLVEVVRQLSYNDGKARRVAKNASAVTNVEDAFSSHELRAFVVHIGKTLHSGHYVAYVKRNGTWYLCDDTRVVPDPKDLAAQQEQAYLLYYGSDPEVAKRKKTKRDQQTRRALMTEKTESDQD